MASATQTRAEARSEKHRTMTREDLAKLFFKNDKEATYELARRAANRVYRER